MAEVARMAEIKETSGEHEPEHDTFVGSAAAIVNEEKNQPEHADQCRR